MNNYIKTKFYQLLDRIFTGIDKQYIFRTSTIKMIPSFSNRKGGKVSYAEWAHVIGIFQTIIYQTLQKKTGNKILDVGCGTGLLGISSEPFVSGGGFYTGIDVVEKDISFCQVQYKKDNYHFLHLDYAHPVYAKSQSTETKPWPLKDGSYNLVTALSVWTHLNEADAIYFFKEIARVLEKGGKAIVTFFLLDDTTGESVPARSDSAGRFHSTNQLLWIFDQSAYGSAHWLHPKWASIPENAIGVTSEGLNILLEDSGLKLINYYPGNWKENPGVFFQDILIFEK
jgi:2-polyprenyl-3-methyl-5-hydroxy-6-metoxy-1,4-benzoquinol methylase